VIDERQRLDRHRDPDVGLAEHLLQRVEGEARQLALDQVRPVLHHDAQLAVALRRLPHRHEVQAVHALVADPVLDALLARELDAPRLEQRPVVHGVLHLDQARVEVDLGRERRDRHQRRAPDREDRRDGFWRGTRQIDAQRDACTGKFM